MKKKNFITYGLLGLVTGGGIIAGFNLTSIVSVQANPDYICVKSVSHGVCDHINRCDAWNMRTHTRTCYGYNVTKTAYYHTRTSCEPGYTVEKRGTTKTSSSASTYIAEIDYNALDSEGKAATTSHPSSGRHSRDVTRETESCTIQQVDTTQPIGTEQTDYTN